MCTTNKEELNIYSERIIWVDYIKAICITLMVLGHAGVNESIGKIIYSFHMPMLFVISGYLYKPLPFQKTAKHLFIPLILFSIIRYLYFVIKSLLFAEDLQFVIDWTSYYRGGSTQCLFVGQWFLFVLFICRALLGDIKIFECIRKNYKIVSYSMILWMGIFNNFIESTFRTNFICISIGAFPFMCLGLYLRENNKLLKETSNIKAVALLMTSLAISLTNNRVDMAYNQYGYNYVIVLMAISTMTLSLSTLFQRCKTNNFIRIISQGTLFVLGIHVLVFSILNCLIGQIEITRWENSLIKTFCVLFLSYYLIPLCISFAPWIMGKERKTIMY